MTRGLWRELVKSRPMLQFWLNNLAAHGMPGGFMIRLSLAVAMDNWVEQRRATRDRAGDFQDRARTGLGGTLMVVAGAVLAGAVQLRADGLVSNGGAAAGLLVGSLWLTFASIVLGVAFFAAKFLEAEAVRRREVGAGPKLNGELSAYSEPSLDRWARVGAVAFHAINPLLAIQAASWLLAATFYAVVATMALA